MSTITLSPELSARVERAAAQVEVTAQQDITAEVFIGDLVELVETQQLAPGASMSSVRKTLLMNVLQGMMHGLLGVSSIPDGTNLATSVGQLEIEDISSASAALSQAQAAAVSISQRMDTIHADLQEAHTEVQTSIQSVRAARELIQGMEALKAA